jgi:hypothetical protein
MYAALSGSRLLVGWVGRFVEVDRTHQAQVRASQEPQDQAARKYCASYGHAWLRHGVCAG